MKKVIFEKGVLDDGMGYSFFGQIENDDRNGLGVLHWDLDSSHSTYYSYAFGKFKDGYRAGFGLSTSSSGVLFNTHTAHWDATGCSVYLTKETVDFYYEDTGKRLNRSFLFTTNSNVLVVSFYDDKGEVTHKKQYTLPFTFQINWPSLFSLTHENYPRYYSDGGVTASSPDYSSSKKYIGIKEFNNGTQIGVFKDGKCQGVGCYHFNKSQDVVVGDFDGIYNEGYVLYTYDSGKSVRYGLLDRNDKWQGFVVEFDDEYVLSILEKKDGKTINSWRIADLKEIGEGDGGSTGEGQQPPLGDLIKGGLFGTDETNPQEEEKGPKKTKSKRMSIDELIGLETVKHQIKRFTAFVKKNKGKDIGNSNLHMCFTGNPGTGKTLVARLIASELKEAGILKTDKLVETDRSGLVAQYIGQTAPLVNEKVQAAMGGVLFIDEAYTLYQKDAEKDFGVEAIAALVKAMEDYRGQFIVIFAGYKDEMEEMLKFNPGLRSRIGYHFDFPNYTKDELKEIAKLIVKDMKYEITETALDLVIEVVTSRIYEKTFANARDVRNVLEQLIMIQCERTLDDQDNRTIEEIDVRNYAKEIDFEITEKGQDIEGGEFDKLVGLETVKQRIKRIEAFVNKNKDIQKMNTHMVFTGNPGTGKTTVARLLSNILFRAGLLPSNKLIEVDRAGLVGRYVGETETKTNEVIKKALGGVLFIDEAYALAGGENDYGHEALAILLKAMEDYRGKLCVIFAGYEREMRTFLASNSGLKSRIQFHINFPDYTAEELTQIASNMIENKKYKCAKDVIVDLVNAALTLKNSRDFANARTIRNFVDSLIMIQNTRTIGTDDREIIKEDVDTLIKDEGLSLKASKKDEVEPISYDYAKKLSDEWKDEDYVFSKQDTDERVIHLTNKTADGASEGSGFIISPDGYYLTCNHCVEGSVDLKTRVTFYTRQGKRVYVEYDTVVVRTSKEHDCALCKILNLDCELPYMPLSFEPIDTLKDNYVVLAGYPHGLRRVNEISFFEGRVISQQHTEDDDKIYTDIMGKSGCSGSAVFYKENGRVIGIFCGAMLSHNQNLVEEMNYLKPISHAIDLFKK